MVLCFKARVRLFRQTNTLKMRIPTAMSKLNRHFAANDELRGESFALLPCVGFLACSRNGLFLQSVLRIVLGMLI